MLSLDSFLSAEDQTRSFQTSVTFREILERQAKSQQTDHIPGFLTCCPDLLLNPIQASVNWRSELIISTIQTKRKELFCYIGWIFRFERREWRKKKEKKNTAVICLPFKCAFLAFSVSIFHNYVMGLECLGGIKSGLQRWFAVIWWDIS